MIVNGLLYTKSETIGSTSFDTNGDPIKSESIWIEPIPCHIITVRKDEKGIYADGRFTQSTYEILIELQDYEAKIVRIENDHGKNLGEFKVQNIEFLKYVGKVKITV